MLLGLAFALTSAVTACNANDLTSTAYGDAPGTYALQSLNGRTLPYTFSNNTVLISEQLTLNADGSYDDVGHYNTGPTTTEYGYYSVQGNEITFNDQTDNITYKGSLTNGVLTQITGQFTAVYVKNQ